MSTVRRVRRHDELLVHGDARGAFYRIGFLPNYPLPTGTAPYDGRLVQCCADWEQSSVMGDLSRDPLPTIWHGARYTEMRRRFLTGEVQGTLCDGCTKDAVAG